VAADHVAHKRTQVLLDLVTQLFGFGLMGRESTDSAVFKRNSSSSPFREAGLVLWQRAEHSQPLSKTSAGWTLWLK